MSKPEHPSDSVLSTIQVRGHTVSYMDEPSEGSSDGPIFVLLHGVPGSVRDFRWFTPVLRKHGRCLSVDMPGFGGTVESAAGLSIEARAGFVAEFCLALQVKHPILVGHSMGGIIATAAVEATRARGLVLLASPGILIHDGFRRFPYRSMSRLFRGRFGSLARGVLKARLAQTYRAAGFRHATEREHFFSIELVGVTSMGRHARNLYAIAVPIFSAFTDNDLLVDPPVMAATARALGATTVVYQGGGHNLQKHHAVELASALGEWSAALPTVVA